MEIERINNDSNGNPRFKGVNKMKSYVYTYDEKPTKNGWSYKAVRVYEIKKGELIYLGEKHYTFEDQLQAVCNFLSETQKQYKRFPKNFICPNNSKLTKDRTELEYSNGYTQNYVDYLEKETRYTDNKQLKIRAIGGTITDLGKRHGNYIE